MSTPVLPVVYDPAIRVIRPEQAGDSLSPVITSGLTDGAVTGKKLSSQSIRLAAFTGHNMVGACSINGQAGDSVTSVLDLTDSSDYLSSFETTLTVDFEIQQTDGADLSMKKLVALLINKQT